MAAGIEISDPVAESEWRWKSIDLTQYCGKSAGEIIDAFGIDERGLLYYPEPENNSTFPHYEYSFNGGVIDMWPSVYKYCNTDRPLDEWKMADFRKERMDVIRVYIYRAKSESGTKTEGQSIEKDGFAIDYPNYIGRTIGELINDIGYPCDSCVAQRICDFTSENIYIGCILRYDYPIEINATFEKAIHQKESWGGKRKDYKEFLDQKISRMEIRLDCRKKE